MPQKRRVGVVGVDFLLLAPGTLNLDSWVAKVFNRVVQVVSQTVHMRASFLRAVTC